MMAMHQNAVRTSLIETLRPAIGAYVLAIFIACQQKEIPRPAGYGEGITFRTGFPLCRPLSGIFLDRQSGVERIYFADAVTQKKILFFTVSGSLTDSISLDLALDSLDQIGGLSVVDPDTIILTGLYSNKVLIIDHHGQPYRSIDFTDQLRLSNGLQYELWHSNCSPFMVGGQACFEVALVSSSLDAYLGNRLSDSESVFDYYLISRSGPQTAVIDFWLEAPKLNLGPLAMQESMDSVLMLTPEVGTYACVNNKWLDYSTYSDCISIINPTGFQKINDLTFRSEISTTHLDAIPCIKGQTLNIQDSVNARSARGGCIQSVHFDRSSGHYLICLLHRVEGTYAADSPKRVKKYSLLEYDSAFMYVAEHRMEEGTHILPFMFNLSTGSYVLRREDRRTRALGIHTFDRLLLNAR